MLTVLTRQIAVGYGVTYMIKPLHALCLWLEANSELLLGSILCSLWKTWYWGNIQCAGFCYNDLGVISVNNDV